MFRELFHFLLTASYSMPKEYIHVGLEIGTTKVCAVVVGVGVGAAGAASSFRVLGVGEVPSRGVRKGEVTDIDLVKRCVHEALGDAEEKAKVEIHTVVVSVTGAHMQSLNAIGELDLPFEDNEITEIHVQEVENKAHECGIPRENRALHTVLQHYYVDGQEGVENPVGMVGGKLEGGFHIMHGISTRVENTLRCVKDLEVDVDDVVVASLASAQAVLDQHQKDLGVLLLDIGGGVTDYILYRNGAVRHSGVLAVGGDHVTNDLAMGLRIPTARAEKLKCSEASCQLEGVKPDDTIVLKAEGTFAGGEIQRKVLNYITRLRVEELFCLIRKKIEPVCRMDLIAGGVVITGGCSALQGIQVLAEEVFGVPVKRVGSGSSSRARTWHDDPRYSTAIGAARHAHLLVNDGQDGGFFTKIKDIFFKG